MIDPATLEAMSTDPALFQAELIIPIGGGSRRFGDVMAPHQAETFDALNPSLLAVARGERPPIPRFWIERTKGGSKDSDLTVAVLWLLVFTRRALLIHVGAADQDQAGEMHKAAADLLELNPWLAELVKLTTNKIACPHNRATCEILAADVAGSHGSRAQVTVINELSHIPKRQFAENLSDNAMKNPFGLAIIATNAGYEGTWQHAWREIARTSDRWSFHRLAEPSPWVEQADLDEAKRRNPAKRYRRLWWGVWAMGGDGDAIDENLIRHALTLPGPQDRERGFVYVGGLDLGWKRDSSAFCVVGRHVGWHERVESDEPKRYLDSTLRAAIDVGLLIESDRSRYQQKMVHHAATHRLKVCHLERWRPESGEVDFAAIEAAVAAAHRMYGLASVAFDPTQAEYMGQRLRAMRVPVVPVPFTGPSIQVMAQEVLSAFTDKLIDLFPDDDLLADLSRISVIEKAYGIKLVSPRDERGHGDSATALALALLAAKPFRTAVSVVDRPLVHWPPAR